MAPATVPKLGPILDPKFGVGAVLAPKKWKKYGLLVLFFSGKQFYFFDFVEKR